MKFNVIVPIEIDDSELLELINNYREGRDLSMYEEINEIPQSEILEFLEEDEFIRDQLDYLDFEDIKLTVLE